MYHMRIWRRGERIVFHFDWQQAFMMLGLTVTGNKLCFPFRLWQFLIGNGKQTKYNSLLFKNKSEFRPGEEVRYKLEHLKHNYRCINTHTRYCNSSILTRHTHSYHTTCLAANIITDVFIERGRDLARDEISRTRRDENHKTGLVDITANTHKINMNHTNITIFEIKKKHMRTQTFIFDNYMLKYITYNIYRL